MEARYQRKLQSGENYNHFFPTATGKNVTIRGNADVSHTLELIPKVVKDTLHQTTQLAHHLKGNTLNETCENIWDFVYQHIAYQKDEDGKEQIRSPARTWKDRKHGVDCDCYTTFISSLLTNLNIPHVYRITKYFKPHYQHIYPIVPLPNGKHITIDCVVEKYNYEEPYSAKKDTKMDLQYLNGIEEEETLFTQADNVDVQDLIGFDYEFEMGDLGRRKSKAVSSYEPKHRSKVGNVLHKVIHVANKANPATVLLRNGVLASMKLNIFKVAQRLKWAYLSDADAQKKGVDMAKFQRLKNVRAKLESIFYGSGGKPESLKNAILKGKGNKGHEVNGFGGYEDELSDLGDPATGAALASATAVIASIAGVLKSIGNLFPKHDEASQDFENTESANDQSTTSSTSIDEKKTVEPSITEEGKANPQSNVAPSSETDNTSNQTAMMRTTNPANKEASATDEKSDDDTNKKDGESMWDKNKKWMKPTLIGVGSVGLLFLGYKVLNANKPKASPTKSKSLNGVRKRKKSQPKKTHHKKRTVHKQSLF